MKRFLMRFVCVAACLSAYSFGYADNPVARGTSETPDAKRIAGDIKALMQERNEVLADFAARYEAAPLDQRTAMEAEGARLSKEYEERYLTMVIEYYTLAGNTAQVDIAQRSLDQLQDGVVTGTPQTLSRNMVIENEMEANENVEGVTHER